MWSFEKLNSALRPVARSSAICKAYFLAGSPKALPSFAMKQPNEEAVALPRRRACHSSVFCSTSCHRGFILALLYDLLLMLLADVDTCQHRIKIAVPLVCSLGVIPWLHCVRRQP